MHASLSAFLGSVFVLLAGANVWGMLHASRRLAGNVSSTRLIWAHRIGGYAFVALFCAMFFFMALRLKGATDELPPRIILHMLLALLLAPVLLVKVLIARYYKQYSSALLPLGVTIFALSFGLVSMNLLPYLLGSAGNGGAPAALSRGFLAITCVGSGFLLARRPRQRTPAISGGASHRATDELGAAPSPARDGTGRQQVIRLQLARIDAQTHDAKTLRFLVVDGASLGARPGQFLTFQWRIDGKVIPRAYSICSSPAQSAHVEITPKRVPNGRVSSFLNEGAVVGLAVEASGPYGRFCFDELQHDRIVLIAAGSGITPMMSMLRYIDDRCLATSVTLLYCVRTRNDVIFDEEIQHLRRRLQNFHMVLILSQSDAAWNGPRGRISRELIAARVEDLRTSTFFLCGPPAFMETVQDILRSLGVEPERVKRESFGTIAGGNAADTAVLSSPGEVEFTRSGKLCAVAPGQTLLEAAEMHAVEIPSGCRQGRCGTCATKLLEGDVQMDVEEGLQPSAKDEGYILACVARPRGHVKLDA